MKKAKMILLCFALVLTFAFLTSCNGTDGKENNTGNGQETSVQTPGTTVDPRSEDTSKAPNPQETETEPQTEKPEETTTIPEIRLGDDKKEWGTYTPVS